MSNVGVFGWIRENVRRSVLLGFSDAVEQLGVTSDADEQISPRLAAVLNESATQALVHMESEPRLAQPKPKHKRLGRSLDQLRTTPPARLADDES
jgi:hypothetical protein